MSAGATGLVRLNKLLASKGFGSRREANDLIRKGLVQINGVVTVEPGLRVDPAEYDDASKAIKVDVTGLQPKTTVLLHKPLGIVSCQPERPDQIPAIKLLTKENYHHYQAPPSVEAVGNKNHNQTTSNSSFRGKEPYRLPKMAVAGRLDVNSTGLLVLTQCGQTAAQIIGPQSSLEKEYLVRLQNVRDLTDPDNSSEVLERLERLRDGIECSGDLLHVQQVAVLNEHQLQFTLVHGQKHHIRRMLAQVGWTVQALKRVRIGHLTLGHLPKGQWRFLGADEAITPSASMAKENGKRGKATTRTNRRQQYPRR